MAQFDTFIKNVKLKAILLKKDFKNTIWRKPKRQEKTARAAAYSAPAGGSIAATRLAISSDTLLAAVAAPAMIAWKIAR